MVGVVDEVCLREDDDNSLAGVDDLAGERLVEFRMRLGRIDEEGTDVGFLDGGEGAKGGEFFNTDFAFAGFAEAGGVEDFEGAVMKADFGAVNIASGSLTRADESLLLLTERVEKAGFADVWAADEGNFETVITGLRRGGLGEVLVDGRF